MNVPLKTHPLIGTRQVLLPPGCTPNPAANTPARDGKTIARYGDEVIVAQVYENWNGVPGLTMAYVYVPSTGHNTHLSLREMGLAPGEGKEES